MRRKTNAEFVKEVEDKVGGDYTFLSPYVNSRTNLKVLHNLCGNTYEVNPNSFLMGRRCAFCSGNEAKRKTTEQFKEEVYSLVKEEYTILGEYTNRVENIEIRHEVCGREYKVQPGNFLNGSRCIECYYDSMRSTTDDINRRLNEALGSTYSLITRLGKREVLVHHSTCGEDFVGNMSDLYLGKTSCKFCSGSIGESLVRDYLIENGYSFTEQVKFTELKDINNLTYDFYLEEEKVLVEYQGAQHYKPTSFGSTSAKNNPEVRFARQVKHDMMKREYAMSRGISLIEVPYTANNKEKVKTVLDHHLIQ